MVSSTQHLLQVDALTDQLSACTTPSDLDAEVCAACAAVHSPYTLIMRYATYPS